MDPQNIILYSLRAQNWVYDSGTYGSEANRAMKFTWDGAVAYAKMGLPTEGPSQHLPVHFDVLNDIKAIPNVER